MAGDAFPLSPGEQLKAARTGLGLRLVDVAASAGCAVSLVSMVEHGYIPGADRQEAIARAVGASSGAFWPGSTT